MARRTNSHRIGECDFAIDKAFHQTTTMRLALPATLSPQKVRSNGEVAAIDLRLATPPVARPSWDADIRELRYCGQLVLRFCRIAQHLELVLSAFQEQAWKTVIDDPLPGTSRPQAHQRLRDAVRHLNAKLFVHSLHFRVERDGTAIRWERVPTSDSPQFIHT